MSNEKQFSVCDDCDEIIPHGDFFCKSCGDEEAARCQAIYLFEDAGVPIDWKVVDEEGRKARS